MAMYFHYFQEKDYPLKQVKIEQLQMSLEYLDELHEVSYMHNNNNSINMHHMYKQN